MGKLWILLRNYEFYYVIMNFITKLYHKKLMSLWIILVLKCNIDNLHEIIILLPKTVEESNG